MIKTKRAKGPTILDIAQYRKPKIEQKWVSSRPPDE
jgi:hypothetical protein